MWLNKKDRLLNNNQKGVILLLTVFIIFFMSVFIVGYLEIAATETEIMRNHRGSTQALYIADAGIEDALWQLRQNRKWKKGFKNKVFPSGESSSYTVTINNKGYPSVIIASTGTAPGNYQRQVEMGITITSTSAPCNLVVNYWKEI
ncbi:MAG: hypothetical protein GY853_12300 [PVC group bacterium]|nr:hypothetical protein [PVC group bacterium]